MKEEIIETMKNRGCIITDRQKWIVEAVCQVEVIDSIDDFWIKLRENRSVSWSTVRTTFRFMTLCGILRRESRGNRSVSYRLMPQDNT